MFSIPTDVTLPVYFRKVAGSVKLAFTKWSSQTKYAFINIIFSLTDFFKVGDAIEYYKKMKGDEFNLIQMANGHKLRLRGLIVDTCKMKTEKIESYSCPASILNGSSFLLILFSWQLFFLLFSFRKRITELSSGFKIANTFYFPLHY